MRDRLAVTLSALLFVASQANLVVMLAPLHPSIFSLQLSFTPETFWNVIDIWGASGLAVYREHFKFDNVHPFIYGAFGFLLVSRTALFSGVQPWVYRVILLLLPVAGLFDLIENAAHIYLLRQPHGFQSVIVPFSGTCSLLKWVLASLFASLVTIQVSRKLWANPSFHRICAKSRAGR
jgi:hypothetical protein